MAKKLQLLRCIGASEKNEEQLRVGAKYWGDLIDEKTINVYFDNYGTKFIGQLSRDYFMLDYRYLRYSRLSEYINSDTKLLLIDIIENCIEHNNDQVCEKALLFIHDKGLDTEENMYKDFVIESRHYKEFVDMGNAKEYMNYLGYYVRCVENN